MKGGVAVFALRVNVCPGIEQRLDNDRIDVGRDCPVQGRAPV